MTMITFTLGALWTLRAPAVGVRCGECFEVFDELTMARRARTLASNEPVESPAACDRPGTLALVRTVDGWRLNGLSVGRPGSPVELDAVRLSMLLADYVTMTAAAMPPAPPPLPGAQGWRQGTWLN